MWLGYKHNILILRRYIAAVVPVMFTRLLNIRIIEHIDRDSARGNHWLRVINTKWGLLLGND
jgi:hypothetical protein